MNALQIILNILLIIASLVMIVTVLLQSSDSDGMGAISGSTETFFGMPRTPRWRPSWPWPPRFPPLCSSCWR